MQKNLGKCHLILSTVWTNANWRISNWKNCQKLLGVKTDTKPSLDKHIKTTSK